ncbi:HD domain-containing protein [Patescibacteria group bacterium]|nr:HD domain-containing protein [Patescibacteria group bacterium]
MPKDITNFVKNFGNPELIQEAFEFAENAYKDRKMVSGEDYINHAIRVASILNEIGLDIKTVIAGLLHDVFEDILPSTQKIQLNEIERKFGKEVAFLIEKTSELNKIRYPLIINPKERNRLSREKLESLQNMFLAISGDIRVILIKLASRLDNLDHFRKMPLEQQKIYALETLRIFAPIADKLGVWGIKYKLEDLAFFYLFPEKLDWLHSQIKEKYKERKNYLKIFTKHIKKLLKRNEINAISIDFRPKAYWSTYQKLLKYNNDVERIHDLLALRIIVSTVEGCYKTLGIIHKQWKPLYEEIDDYIAKPKLTGYRSLHTTVFSEDGHITEIQIRTPEMHKEAEYGHYAHYAYKKGIDLSKDKESLKIIQKIPEVWKNFKIDFYENKIFVFTPKGDVISLIKGSTPIDFAYAVHSEIGNHCESAKINSKLVSLFKTLKNGDIIEIIVSKKRGPSMDWLKFVKTNLAISQIKKELAKKGFITKITSLSKIPRLLRRKVFEISERISKKGKPKKKRTQEIYLAGQKGISTTLAKCCNPKSGDKVQAYLSRYRAAVLHKVSCKDFQKLAKKFPDKVIDAEWK